MESSVNQIMAIAEDNDGNYDGSSEKLLPWSFWVQELSDSHADVERMVRVWHGDYIERYLFGEGAGERHGYLFRDGLGFGYLSISENMAFQYFRYFFNREHARREITRGTPPSTTTAGLPSEDAIANAQISGDDLPELLSSLGLWQSDTWRGTTIRKKCAIWFSSSVRSSPSSSCPLDDADVPLVPIGFSRHGR